MYNIYYRMSVRGDDSFTFTSDATTVVSAYMDALREIRKVLNTKDVELLEVGDMEFAIWARGNPQGYVSIKEVGPETSTPDLG